MQWQVVVGVRCQVLEALRRGVDERVKGTVRVTELFVEHNGQGSFFLDDLSNGHEDE